MSKGDKLQVGAAWAITGVCIWVGNWKLAAFGAFTTIMVILIGIEEQV
jgi:hypothetical protein